MDLYGLSWGPGTDPLWREFYMIKKGGQFRGRKGQLFGEGLAFHYRKAQELLWPEKVWHKWSLLELDCFLKYRTIVEIGPASSGKTHSAASNVLCDYYPFAHCTTILCTSTTRDRLEDRVWGEIKKLHALAKDRFPWLAGYLIESKLRIITDGRKEPGEGRDFRNGLIGVPCKKGGDYIGLGDFIGIKNKRVRLLGDELHLLPRVFVDAVSNLDKNEDFKLLALGNPKDTTDALGILAEPAAHLGGWDGGIDQTPGTKTWEIRRPEGICIQLPGSDSPNLDGKLGIPLISQAAIDRDVAFYGKDSLWYTMMNEGRMPRGQGSRRVLTRQFCLKHRAMEEPVWANSNITRIGFLDAAYRGVGGDRCVFGELDFGEEAITPDLLRDPLVSAILSQRPDTPKRKQILALKDTTLVPIKAGYVGTIAEVEDQIATWCMDECKRRGILPEHFFFDAGMRTALVSSFARIWSPKVVPIDFGGKPTERKVSDNIDVLCKDYYSKFVTELWYSVRLVIESEQFRGMTEDVMLEGCAREWKTVGNNKIEVETKEEMKIKTGRSPDLFDGLVTGVEGARRLGFRILNVSKKERPKKGEANWRRELQEKQRQAWHSRDLVHSA